MHTITLVDALKRALKGKGITYAAVAEGLGLSEASVKRMFSRRDFTLQRMDDVFGRWPGFRQWGDHFRGCPVRFMLDTVTPVGA